MGYSLHGKRALVTGATGLLGGRIVQRLVRAGTAVRAFIRNPTKADALTQLGVDIVVGDITNPAMLTRAVEGCQIVYHFAAVLRDFQPRAYYQQVNVRGTEALARAALAAGVERFIHTSTVAVYGLATIGTVTENSPRRASGNAYADTKLEAEQAIRQLIQAHAFPAIVVQPSQVYGPDDTTWTLGPIQLIRAGKMILVNGGTGLVQPLYIDDLIEGILAATRNGVVGETYLLCGPEAVSIRTFFNHYARMVGKDNIPSVPAWLALALAGMAEVIAKITHRPPPFTRQEVPYTMQHLIYDGSKAAQQLGWRPTTRLAEGMEYVETWLRARADR